jgi:Xaa-Pro aminopeptidase
MRSLRDRLAFSVLTSDLNALLVVCNIEESLSKRTSWISDVRSYVERKEHPVDALVAALREKGWDRGRLGYEARFLPAGQFDRLRGALPGVQWTPADDLIISVRAVKSPEEIARFRDAARATERAIQDAFTRARPGDTEKSVNDRIMVNMLDAGADSITHSVFGTGANALHAHAIPGAYPLTPGEVGRVDSGAEFGGYASDLARSLGVGKVPQHVLDAYKRLRMVQRETIDFLRPGRTGADVFTFCKEAYGRHGLTFAMPHVGHGLAVLGGEMHEEPNLHPYNQVPLEAGMIMDVEPFYWDWERGFALHIEDTALVTEQGPVILSDATNTEELFIVT